MGHFSLFQITEDDSFVIKQKQARIDDSINLMTKNTSPSNYRDGGNI